MTDQRIAEVADGAPWQVARLAVDAIPVGERLPAERTDVIGWVSDPSVAIYHFPVIVWRIGDGWWAGLPGSYINLNDKRWTVTHWKSFLAVRAIATSKDTPHAP